MRGAHTGRLRTDGRQGIIPADAGSTRQLSEAFSSRQDHPCGCGEHAYAQSLIVQGEGSSLRMRGAHGAGAGDLLPGRIIPADAGSTIDRHPHTEAGTDHPCGCGEHLLSCVRSFCNRGSSLRMRGAPAQAAHDVMIKGIIPADAGST